MIIEQASVLEVRTSDLWVETRQKSTCGSCVAKSGCGQQLLTRWLQKNDALKVRFDLVHTPELNPGTIRVGDQVEIGIQKGALVAASLVSYGLPLLGLLAGAGLASQLAHPAWLSVLMAAFGLVLAAYTGRLWQSTWRSDYFEPVLVRKLAIISTQALL